MSRRCLRLPVGFAAPVLAAGLLVLVPATGLATNGAASRSQSGASYGVGNARVESREATDPAAVVRSLDGRQGTWVSWTVPGTEQAADLCCFGPDWKQRGCSLAGKDRGWGTSDSSRDPAAPRVLRVLAEIEDARPVRLIAVGLACPIDGGGRRVVELTGVEVEWSLDLLERWSEQAETDRVRGGALAALAHHDTPAAAERLARLARPGQLGQSGKATGQDGDLGHRGRRDLRGQALFWLAQTQDPRAAGWIGDVIADDTDRDIREEAVFALSQLDGSVPLLVRLLRETDRPDVRRHALFWLAQSDDPRALDELDAILNP